LGSGIPLLGGKAVPLHRLGIVLRDAFALGVPDAEMLCGDTEAQVF
jgi:hypothetical protein